MYVHFQSRFAFATCSPFLRPAHDPPLGMHALRTPFRIPPDVVRLRDTSDSPAAIRLRDVFVSREKEGSNARVECADASGSRCGVTIASPASALLLRTSLRRLVASAIARKVGFDTSTCAVCKNWCQFVYGARVVLDPVRIHMRLEPIVRRFTGSRPSLYFGPVRAVPRTDIGISEVAVRWRCSVLVEYAVKSCL